MSAKTLYEPLGGYDAIIAVANVLLPRHEDRTRPCFRGGRVPKPSLPPISMALLLAEPCVVRY